MKARNYLLSLVLLLSACTFFGQPTPETFNERVLYAKGTLVSVLESANTLLSAGAIDRDTYLAVREETDKAATTIKLAQQVWATNPQEAENRLTTALTLLEALRAYLIDAQQRASA